MQTYYVVQSYSVSANRKVEPELPRLLQSLSEAMRLAERLSESKFGVVAFSRSGDALTGDWEDASIIFQSGNFSAEDAEAIELAA